MSAHTPGPWMLCPPEDLRGGRYHVVQIADEMETIDLRDDENGEANANLIAAAPDMHASLSDLAQVFLARPDILGLCGPHEHALIRAACDALNKSAGAVP